MHVRENSFTHTGLEHERHTYEYIYLYGPYITGQMHGKGELSPSNDMNINKFLCMAQIKGELSPRTRL